jgi:hypothetical protein
MDKVYETTLLRSSYRVGGKVKTETPANLSHLRPETIEAVRASLASKTVVEAGEGWEVERSLPYGHVAAVWAMAHKLGLAKLLGPPLVGRHHPGRGPRVAGAPTDDVDGAMDWLVGHHDSIKVRLDRRHLAAGGRVLYDLSSSWVEGSCCPLAARGRSRDGKMGKAQIE